MRALRGLIIVVGVSVVAALVVVVWLYANPPQPRPAAAWALGPDLPATRGELATAVAYAEACTGPCREAERLYVVGGLSGFFHPEDSVAIYDPNRKLWATGPALPAPRHHLAAARLGQDLYVSGGATVAGADLGQHDWPLMDNFWRLTPGADHWEVLPAMIEPRWGHRMVAHGGRLYIVGGRGGSGRVLIYAPSEGWKLGAALPRGRDHLSLVVVGDGIWAIGGRDPRSLAQVDIYNPSADSWERGPDLPYPTSGAAEAVVDDVIFIFGGEEPSFVGGGVNDRHWKLDTRSQTRRWEAAAPPPLAVHGTSGAVLQNRIVLAGGASRHGALSVTAWSSALQLFEPANGR